MTRTYHHLDDIAETDAKILANNLIMPQIS